MDRGAWWAAVHGVAKSRTRLSDFTFTFHFHALEKAMAPHSSVLAWRIPGMVEPDGLPSMGSHRVGQDWSDLAAAAAALLVAMLPKARLTSHSMISGSRWVITPWWLCGLWRSFLYSSSVYSRHLFLISVSVHTISDTNICPYHFCPLLSPSLHEMFPWYS